VGDPGEAERLLAGPHPPRVQLVYDRRHEANGAARLRLRARARLLLGRLPDAAADLRAAALHLAAPEQTNGVLGIGRHARPTTNTALLQALEGAAELAERGDGAAALEALPPIQPF
jgi:hypothetical protein